MSHSTTDIRLYVFTELDCNNEIRMKVEVEKLVDGDNDSFEPFGFKKGI